MDGSAFQLTVADFYRPSLRKFSPMTRADLITRTGATDAQVKDLVRRGSRNGLLTASGHAQNVKPIYYTLTPAGEAAALAMMRKVTVRK
jgi:DNA-binding MarR family transcriptional regulator